MSQPERPDEAAAAEVVCRETGATLHYSGQAGGIDYTGKCGTQSIILEVTRFTDRTLLRDWDAAVKFDDAPEIPTRSSWWLTFEGHPYYAELEKRLGPALQELEFHGLSYYYRPDMAWWMSQVPSLRESIAALNQEQVTAARVLETKVPPPPSYLFVSSSGAWSYGGANEALAVLETYLTDEEKHLTKTSVEPADVRHLFVWSDTATTNEYSRALSEDRYWPILPTRAPNIPHAIDHLWLVYEPTGLGWHWTALTGWQTIQATEGTF